MNKPVYLRGDIYYADLGEGFGSEQQGCGGDDFVGTFLGAGGGKNLESIVT